MHCIICCRWRLISYIFLWASVQPRRGSRISASADALPVALEGLWIGVIRYLRFLYGLNIWQSLLSNDFIRILDLCVIVFGIDFCRKEHTSTMTLHLCMRSTCHVHIFQLRIISLFIITRCTFLNSLLQILPQTAHNTVCHHDLLHGESVEVLRYLTSIMMNSFLFWRFWILGSGWHIGRYHLIS